MSQIAGLEVRDVESLREHYALTLRQWVATHAQRVGDELTDSGRHGVSRGWEI